MFLYRNSCLAISRLQCRIPPIHPANRRSTQAHRQHRSTKWYALPLLNIFSYCHVAVSPVPGKMTAQTHHQPVSDLGGGAPQLSALSASAPPFAASTTASNPATSASGHHEPTYPLLPLYGSEGTFLLDEPPAAGHRDSFLSILEDPFFLRFTDDSPDASNDERHSWIPPRKDSLKNEFGATPWVRKELSREDRGMWDARR